VSDLLVITFQGEETAGAALHSIRNAEKGGGLALSDTAVIRKDGQGQVHIDNEWSSGAEVGAVAGGAVGALATFFFPIVGAAVGAGLGALVGSKFDTGVDQDFAQDVAKGLAPGSSALFLMLKGEEPAAVVSAFEPYEGTVYQTTLAPDFEDQLRRALNNAR
jgi:uncharacterized membrane protein